MLEKAMHPLDPRTEALIRDIIRIEGDFSDDPKDAGGPTRYGVTENVARVFGYKGDMRDLPMETAKAIYRHQYYLLPRFDLVAAQSAAVAAELFEVEVNLPPFRAAKFLQRALNGLNQEGSTYPDLVVDGRIGRVTGEALKKYLKARGAEGERVLLGLLNAQQGVYYLERAEARPANERFLYGWLKNRVIM